MSRQQALGLLDGEPAPESHTGVLVVLLQLADVQHEDGCAVAAARIRPLAQTAAHAPNGTSLFSGLPGRSRRGHFAPLNLAAGHDPAAGTAGRRNQQDLVSVIVNGSHFGDLAHLVLQSIIPDADAGGPQIESVRIEDELVRRRFDLDSGRRRLSAGRGAARRGGQRGRHGTGLMATVSDSSSWRNGVFLRKDDNGLFSCWLVSIDEVRVRRRPRSQLRLQTRWAGSRLIHDGHYGRERNSTVRP